MNAVCGKLNTAAILVERICSLATSVFIIRYNHNKATAKKPIKNPLPDFNFSITATKNGTTAITHHPIADASHINNAVMITVIRFFTFYNSI